MDLFDKVWKVHPDVQLAAGQSIARKSKKEEVHIRLPKGLRQWVQSKGWNLSEVVEMILWEQFILSFPNGDIAFAKYGGDAKGALLSLPIKISAKKIWGKMVASDELSDLPPINVWEED